MEHLDKGEFSWLRNASTQSPQSNKSSIDSSGNSDVNVDANIQVDTIPIAFAVLYYLLATKQLSHEEFEYALRKLLETTNKYKKLNRDGSSRVNLLHPNVWGR